MEDSMYKDKNNTSLDMPDLNPIVKEVSKPAWGNQQHPIPLKNKQSSYGQKSIGNTNIDIEDNITPHRLPAAHLAKNKPFKLNQDDFQKPINN